MTVPTLEGRAVRLRAPETRDYETLFDWYNDPDTIAPYDRFSTESYESFRSGLESAESDPSSLAARFVVALKEDDRPIGFVGFYQAHPVLEYTDIWYILGDRTARGKGYGSECVGLLVDHVFHVSSLERVGATSDVENVPSQKLLESLGFRREGTLRSSLFHHGKWHDVHVYGVIRSEWADRARKS